MKENDLSALTDQELLQEVKKRKTAAITNAVIIGFCIGVIFYSVIKSSWGFFTLIPMFIIYKLVNNSKYDNEALEKLLKERNLK